MFPPGCHPRLVRQGLLGRALVAGLSLAVLPQLACEATHLIGSAGFVRTRGVEPQLGQWTAAQIELGDLDDDGQAELLALDPTRAELCLRRADPAASQPLLCQVLDSADQPSRLRLGQLAQNGRPQLVTAGRALSVYAPWVGGQPLVLRQRSVLPEGSAQLERSRGWQAGGQAPIDTLWTASSTPPRVTAWTFTRPEQSGGGAPPSAIDFPLSAAATALLPRSPRRDSGRDLFVATPLGVDWWRSSGAYQALPCSGSLAGSVRLAALDIDGDDDEDLLGLHPDGSLTVVERLAGSPGWGCSAAPPSLQSGRALLGIWVADFDGDGKDDLLAATAERSEGLLLWRRGQSLLRYPLSAPPRAVAIADADGDQRPDIVVLLSDGSFELWHNSFVPG